MSSIIGYMEIELSIPHAKSLKEKRAVVKRITERLKGKFNVSVSEIGEQDKWQRSVIAVVTVGTSRQVVDATLEKAAFYVEELYPGFTIGHRKEFL
jgi:uncharacterized protein YlxP (DUF503 family)